MSLAQQIARSLQLPERYVLRVATSASYRYRVFTIRKADGRSDRLIAQPSKAVKLLQRWLVKRVFDPLPTHDCAHAYVRGRSIVSNASVHRKSRYISRLDLENFFPNLTSADVASLLMRNREVIAGSALSNEDIELVTSLACRFGRLSIGAPSSPTISNKLMYELDVNLTAISARYAVRYSRYADDLYFSSSDPGILFDVCKRVEDAIRDSVSPRLAINRRKTYHASRKKRMAVTGLLITPEGRISIGRDLKRRTRALAHRASKGNIGPQDLDWLRGMLAYVSSVEPEYVRKIRAKYQLG